MIAEIQPLGPGERLACLSDKTLIVLYWDDELGEWLGAPRPVTHWVDVFGPYEQESNNSNRRKPEGD